jgi:hypothetical protein
MENGELFVTPTGQIRMPGLYADNWGM